MKKITNERKLKTFNSEYKLHLKYRKYGKIAYNIAILNYGKRLKFTPKTHYIYYIHRNIYTFLYTIEYTLTK